MKLAKNQSDTYLKWTGFIVTICVNIWTIFFLRNYMDFDHEGALFKPAFDLAHGRMLYRDSFAQYGPMSIIFEALYISLFGPFVAGVKSILLIIYGLTSLFLYSVWRKFAPAYVAFFSVIIWNFLNYQFVHPPLVWSASFAVMFQSMAIFYFLKAVEIPHRRSFFLAGIFTCLVIFSKQNVGVYLLAAELTGLIYIKIDKKYSFNWLFHNACTFIGGNLLVVTMILGWLKSNGALGAWWGQNFVWPRRWSDLYGGNNVSTILSRLFLIGDVDPSPGRKPSLIFIAMPLTCLAIVIWSALTKLFGRKLLSPPILLTLCSLCCVASWLHYFPIVGILHVWWAASPCIGVFVFALWWLTKGFLGTGTLHKKSVPAFLLFILLITFGSDIYTRLQVSWSVFSDPRETVSEGGPLKGLVVSPLLHNFIKEVDKAIKTEVTSQGLTDVLLFGTAGIYLTFIPDATFFHPLWAAEYREVIPILYPDMPQRIVAFVNEKHPVVISDIDYRAKVFLDYFKTYRIVSDIRVAEPRQNSSFMFFLMKDTSK